MIRNDHRLAESAVPLAIGISMKEFHDIRIGDIAIFLMSQDTFGLAMGTHLGGLGLTGMGKYRGYWLQ